MADTLMMWDGNIQTIFSLDDFIQLVDEYMGVDARRWLEARLSDLDEAWSYTEELKREIEGSWEHHRDVMARLRELSEQEAHLISQKRIDRKKLSNIAGEIGTITWREINA